MGRRKFLKGLVEHKSEMSNRQPGVIGADGGRNMGSGQVASNGEIESMLPLPPGCCSRQDYSSNCSVTYQNEPNIFSPSMRCF